jgi:hypothetical protein
VVDYESLIACRMGCMAFILCTHDVAGADGVLVIQFLDGAGWIALGWLGYTSASHFPSGLGFCTRHMIHTYTGQAGLTWLLPLLHIFGPDSDFAHGT